MRVVKSGQIEPSGPGVRFYPQDPTAPRIVALRPLALAILNDYGLAVNGDPVAVVSAVVDWIARIAIHGYSLLHPPGYARNMTVLPTGKNWTDVQTQLSTAQQNTDNAYWTAFLHDGTVMLDKLLGTLNLTDGTRAADGALQQITTGGAQARWQYRSMAQLKSVWCTHQHDIATCLLAALGFPTMLTHQTGHDPLRVQYGANGQWGYWCSTYNEHYVQLGSTRPLDTPELRDLTQIGNVAQIQKAAHTGPFWETASYIQLSYLAEHPTGWPQISVSYDSRVVGGIASRTDRVLEDPALAGSGHVLDANLRTDQRTATPYLGAYLLTLPLVGLGSTTARVASGWPGTTGFVQQIGAGAWTALASVTDPVLLRLAATARLADGLGTVRIAPVDGYGQRGPNVELSV